MNILISCNELYSHYQFENSIKYFPPKILSRVTGEKVVKNILIQFVVKSVLKLLKFKNNYTEVYIHDQELNLPVTNSVAVD